jgi:hypothetical protein
LQLIFQCLEKIYFTVMRTTSITHARDTKASQPILSNLELSLLATV